MSDLGPIATHLAAMLNAEHPKPKAARDYPKAKDPWAADYNPVEDAVAVVVFGARFLRPGRYLSPDGLLMDHNGALLDPAECPECGTVPGSAQDYRFMVRVIRPEHVFAKKPIYEWTYCRRCVSEDEIERVRTGAAAAPPPPARQDKKSKPERAGRRLIE